MAYILAERFSLKDTLESGQFFRFSFEDGQYIIQEKDKVFALRQEGEKIYYTNIGRRFLKRFLGLDHDIRRISSVFDKNIMASMKNYPGIRIMRQDPWECTLAFILSSASNIPRIRKNLGSLADRFGSRLLFHGKEYFTLPLPSELGDEREIRRCGVGFRARYLERISKVDLSFFEKLKNIDYKIAKNMLIELPGIGGKIADCILLFAYGHLNSFPVDVWIKRAMQNIYFGGKNRSNEEIASFAQKRFYPYAGYAQQFLYHNSRVGVR